MHALAAVLLTASLGGISPGNIETRATRHILQEFERVGRNAPQEDPALSQAARALAKEAVQMGAAHAAEMSAINDAISNADAFDPSPRAFILRGSSPAGALEAFLKRRDLNQEPASRMGVGSSMTGEQTAIVALLVQRRVELKPFHRAFPRSGSSADLCGDLLPPLRSASIFVTRPDGTVDKIRLSQDKEASFCGPIGFGSEGRYWVEVIGRGVQGPEVAALFSVQVGRSGGKASASRISISEPKTVEEARNTLLNRINSMRALHGIPPLQDNATLDAVAQAYSERMAKENFFAHVGPDGSELKTRLAREHYAYIAAGENLGLAPGPVTAHLSIEQSPGHRRNLLDSRFVATGIGIAYRHRSGETEAIVTEVFAKPSPPQTGDPLAEAYRSVDRKRMDLKVPALKRDRTLEKLALSHAQRALDLDQPKAELEGSPPLQDQIFAAIRDVSRASVEFLVSDDPTLVAGSKNLADRNNDLIGIGAIRGDSSRYGKGRYWLVVIYAATRR